MNVKRILKYLYICALLIIVIVAIITVMGQNNKMDSFESRYSFGTVYQGAVLTHSFDITNRYKEELELVDIKSSCSCTTILIGDKTLSPGESTILKMEFNTKEYTGNREVHTFLTGKIKGEKKLIYNFILQANIEKVIEFPNESHYLHLGKFDLQQQSLEVKSFFITKGNYPLEWDLIKCKSSQNNIKCKISRITPNNWKLDIQLNNERELGIIFDDIEFSFWRKGKECDYKLIKPVKAEIVGPIASSPPSLLVGPVTATESITKIINFESRGDAADKTFEILSVNCLDDEWIKADIIEENSKPAIKVVFSPKNEKGAKLGKIIAIIRIDSSEVYKLRIDYLVKIID